MTAHQEIRRLVVVGASLAGLRAVEAARAAGFTGEITLIGAEEHLPYDRTVLSKSFLDHPDIDPPVPHYREQVDLTDQLGVRLLLGAPAERLDAEARTVQVGGRQMPYDRLIVATGVRPRRLPAAQERSGVLSLRTVGDARALRRRLADARRVVVVGAGFIGAEVASAARGRGAETTLVDASPAPLARAVGPELGPLLSRMHTAHGARLRCGIDVAEVWPDRVVLSDDTALDADLVVAGVGAQPAVDWLAGSGLRLDDGVVCGPDLAASLPGIHAAGDAARWYNPLFEREMRLEHWSSAAEQGAIAARNALGASETCATVPYFWSDWYGVRIQFLGVPDAEHTEIFGDVDGHRFVALLGARDRLTGVLLVDRRRDTAKYRHMLRRRAGWREALDFAARREATGTTVGVRP